MRLCVSHGGSNIAHTDAPVEEVVVGTTEGVVFLRRNGGAWGIDRRALTDEHVSAVVFEPRSGRLFASTHGHGVFASADDGQTWDAVSDGLTITNVYSLNYAHAGDAVRLYAGTEPAHLFSSGDLGRTWSELPMLRQVPTVDEWNFPAPPHLAHVKGISIDARSPDVIYASVEQGTGLKSTDAGKTWREMACYTAANHARVTDVHRVVLDPFDPNHLLSSSGDGLFSSADGGDTWTQCLTLPSELGYPDVLQFHPHRPGTVFIAGAHTNPSEWPRIKTANSALCRSRDGGATWEFLHDGFPEHVHGNFAAMSLNAWPGGFSLFAATTDGDVFTTDDEGEHWTAVGPIAPVSKGRHYRLLATA
jgi:photosystem II stability/assembly factor-like uncharacterized protein